MLSRTTLGDSNSLVICSKPAYEKVFLNATPSTSIESCREPPGTFFMPIMSRPCEVPMESTASTTIVAKNSFWPETSFEESEVPAAFCSISRFLASSCASRLTESFSSWAIASAAASRKALTIICGCTPSSMYGLHSRRNSPASSTTEVVPSPTSASCDIEMSTSVLPAGWTIWSCFMSVAPSFEMVTRPLSSWINLSIPRGPRVERTTSTIAWQALMLEMSCGLPCEVSVPSRRRTICGCMPIPIPLPLMPIMIEV
mmetsp:Transcript_42817/g.91394  ORF Transcript_42817/g.91394 Transcript_42817/m.91394 type:complete len:257 (+) Transcript_42817:944-1714(+)